MGCCSSTEPKPQPKPAQRAVPAEQACGSPPSVARPSPAVAPPAAVRATPPAADAAPPAADAAVDAAPPAAEAAPPATDPAPPDAPPAAAAGQDGDRDLPGAAPADADQSRDIPRAHVKHPKKNQRRAPVSAPADFHDHVEKHLSADVLMISGCLDSQTSSDVANVDKFDLTEDVGPGGAGGACTTSLLDRAYKPDGERTWVELLTEMRAFLHHNKYKQIPQLSSSKKIDLKRPFEIVADGATGKKLSVLVGINYTGQKGALRGCCNDVLRMVKYIESEGFRETEDRMKVLLDPIDYEGVSDLQVTPELPTKANILKVIDWLAENAEPGDTVFFHYSGHGTQVKDLDGDEEDGMDEALVPMDYQKAGFITDDTLYEKLCKSLPAGVRVFAMMDCCHSGTILDLPYTFTADEASLAQVYADKVMEPNTGFLGFLGKIGTSLGAW
eukprot:TRINITY_DN2595_c0_g1_i1.p1 TRINITY_DN2595_c0_g1~~TRINITY_DN2595_c0_g1_i1.p1  ORF type:complete len:443 (+),score=142.00 TRINITY_DN2595_c0_g1_i1:65-1393(+)